jgi:hypothetical protein
MFLFLLDGSYLKVHEQTVHTADPGEELIMCPDYDICQFAIRLVYKLSHFEGKKIWSILGQIFIFI